MNFRVWLSSVACVLAGVAIGITAMQRSWLDWLYAHLHYLLAAIILGAIALALLAALAYLALKWWIRHKLDIQGDLTGEQVVIGLADKLTNRDDMDSPTAQDRMHSLMVNLGLYYVRSVAMQRYFLVIGGTFTALIGMATVFLLNEQNKKLDVQTEQIRLQSQANTVASLLMEGTRRAALSSEQTALFADIRAEATAIRENNEGKVNRVCPKSDADVSITHYDLRSCWREIAMLNSKKKIEIVNVSDDLFQRIRAYSLRATPYPTAKRKVEKIGSIDINNPFDEQYDFPVISPERGQLLQTLVLNRVDVIRVKFAGADLQSLDLPSAVLSGADLFEADLSLANLSAADLSGANLSRANLSVANLKVANFSGADLRNATLGQANLSGANLTGANLNEADLFVANLSEATLQNADMLGANLTRANLAGADLSFANLSGVNFFKAQLSKTKLFRTNLTDANLADIEGIPETNEGRRSYLDYWLRSSLASSSGLDEANLPKGFMVSCTSKTKGEFGGSLCMDEGGWTITYVDQPEFAPKVDGRPAKN